MHSLIEMQNAHLSGLVLGMRIKHNYRNISRACKQFLMGDKLLEQAVILSLKYHFYRPMYYQSPIENTFYIVSYDFFLTV